MMFSKESTKHKTPCLYAGCFFDTNRSTGIGLGMGSDSETAIKTKEEKTQLFHRRGKDDDGNGIESKLGTIYLKATEKREES